MDRALNSLKIFIEQYLTVLRSITITDVLEIVIIAVLLYKLVIWILNTKAWMLLRGILVIVVFVIVAAVLNMEMILYLVGESMSVFAIAGIVIFQPELRRALENLGQRNLLNEIVPFDKKKDADNFLVETVGEVVMACEVMKKAKTGALIVVENNVKLTEYESTGIRLDCMVSSQILINIFEHNTPLHDGAVIMRGDRIVSATCYLPLSDNMNLSKDLGTRHRAAVGMSEVSDALVIIVSEETGNISVAKQGILYRNIDGNELTDKLERLRSNMQDEKKASFLTKAFRKRGGNREK